MEIPNNYIEKFRPAASKEIGAPRSSRDEITGKFLAALNAGQAADRRPLYTFSHVAKKLQGRSEPQLYQLFKECSDPSVRSFGAMLTYRLKNTG